MKCLGQFLFLFVVTSSSSFFDDFGPLFVEGWGTLGHEIVANIAWNRLGVSRKQGQHHQEKKDQQHDTRTSPIQDWLINITGPLNGTDVAGSPLAAIADWADRVRHFKPWSAPLHYVDVRDDLYQNGCHYHHHPSSSSSSPKSSTNANGDDICYFDYQRDCPNNTCVAGAIVNYTSQILNLPDAIMRETSSQLLRGGGASPSTAPWPIQQALRFVVHFIGDIHQPLHCSRTTDKGGNDFNVHADFLKNISFVEAHSQRNYYRRRRDLSSSSLSKSNHRHHHHTTWNLHSVWDTGIIEAVMDREYNNSRQQMETDLLSTSYDKDYENKYSECGVGLNQSCTILWGQESFGLAMKYAYRTSTCDCDDDDDEVADGSTLTEMYYETRLPIVKQQLIAGGIRLATTLEALYNATHTSHDNNKAIEDQQQKSHPALSILTNLRIGYAM